MVLRLPAVVVLVASLGFSACGGEEESGSPAAEATTTALPAPTTTAFAPSSTTTARPTTTRSPATTATSRAAPTTRASSPTTTATTVPAGRTVTRGTTFSMTVGETVTVLGEGLSVTYSAVGADNRCRPGQQCIVAGSASVSVTVRKDPAPAATLTLNSPDAPTSGRYGAYTVELVKLGFGTPPVASLRVP